MSAVVAKAVEFAKQYPAEIGWITDNMMGDNFAMSLAGQFDKKGELTPNQIEAVRRNIDRVIARKIAGDAAPSVDVSTIMEKFYAAIENGIKRPKMRLDTFVFKYASGKGALYVTDAESTDADGRPAYLGKVVGNKFLKVSACTEEQERRIVAAAANPEEAAKAFGQRTGNCCICGRTLTAEQSMKNHIGPICQEKFGLMF